MIGSLKNQVISRYLFDDSFQLSEEQEGLCGVKEAIAECLDGIYAMNEKPRELIDREWDVPSKATSFQKLEAAFRSVRQKDTLPVSARQRGDLVGYYQTLRNEILLKESRIILWQTLSGMSPIEKCELRSCTGKEVEQLFLEWLEGNPDCLQIKRLNLSHKKLSVLPPEMTFFTQLESLNLNSNLFKEFPWVICELTQLKRLTLCKNQLVELPPGIEKLTMLETVRFSENQLKSLPAEFYHLSQLKVLWLHKNRLKEIPREILNLTKLKTLHIADNPLEKCFSEIWKLPQLNSLSFPDHLFVEFLVEIGRSSLRGNCRLTSDQIDKLRKLSCDGSQDAG